MNNSLRNLLNKLGLNEDNGLFLKENPLKINSRIKHSLKYVDYDAIYVLDDTPLIIFKQYNSYSNKEIKEFRKMIWNLNDIPIIFIVLPDEIQVYNSNIFDDEESFLGNFSKNEELEIFNIYNLTKGSFFDKYANYFNNSKKVQNYLLNNIKEAIKLLEKDNLPLEIIHSLIGKLIFSKYLIDRGICRKDFFINKYACDFNNIVLKKECLFDFFNLLEERFNPDLFKLTKIQKNKITDKHLIILYKLFNGFDMQNPEQSVLDCPYDFKIIPIELISNIYETFLQDNNFKRSNKSIYTPLFLVDYILNNTLDEKLNINLNCKVLDPSCGSGVFLVESLRRIIDKNLEFKSTIASDDLKKILTSNIYGIDVDRDAIQMTILSIQLTLFDYLDIEEIKNFKMPQLLNKNFFVDDFFNLDGAFNSLNDFDLIVGNPPLGAKQKSHIDYCQKKDLPISNKQIAQSFLLRVNDFINKSSEIALIVSSKILYNRNASKFRKYFLEHFNLTEVLECSSIRKELFNNAISHCSILFYNSNIENSNKIKHISLKPNKLFYLLSSIVIQKSDIKFISQKDLHDHDWVWKVLVYGNTLDFQLINRLHSKQTIYDYVEKNKLSDSYGINVGNKQKDATKYFSYDFLNTNSKMLQRYSIDESHVEKWNIPKVERPRNEIVFNPPYILIKKTLSKNFECVSTYSEKQWVFTDSVMSIKGNDEKLLKSILGFLNSKLFSYLSFLTFSSIGIEREQIFLNEIETIPIIVNDDLVKYVDKMLDSKGLGEFQDKIDDLIFNLLSFSDLERDLVNYFADVTLPMFKKEDVYYKVSNDDLESYIMIFVNYFRNYFKKENNEFFHVECYKSEQFIGIRFIIDDKPSKNLIEYINKPEILNFFGDISIEEKQNLFVQKDIKGFDETSFYVIKSNEFKNWHKAIARKDLIEFTNSLIGVDG